MRITRIEIEEFGRLKDLSMTPAAGLNLIEGANESGKSTLLAFIRFVLYGFPRRGSADGEERDRRLSWENRRAAGYLVLQRADGEYRITRTVLLRGSAVREQTSETLSVLSLADGREMDLGGVTPGEYFLGLPAQLYDSSLYLTQSGAERVCAPGVGEAVGNFLFAGETTLRAEDAEKKLLAARRQLQHIKGRGGRIAELEDDRAALEQTITTARENAARLATLRAEIEELRGEITQKQTRARALSDTLEEASLAQTLSLFEDRERALAREETCRAEQEAWRARADQLPDGQLVPRTEALLDRMSRAAEGRAEDLARAEELRAVRFDEKLIADAEKIHARGGAALLAEQAEQDGCMARRHLVVGGVLAALAVFCALLPLFAPALLAVGAACGGVSLLLALWQFAAGVRRAGRTLSLFGQKGPGGARMLRTYFEQCRWEEEKYLANAQRLQELEERCAKAETLLAEGMAELNSTFGAGEGEDLTPETVRARLCEIEATRREVEAELLAATRALERARGETEALSRRLAGQDEAYLRARLAAPAPVIDVAGLKAEQETLNRELDELDRRRAAAEREEAALSARSADPVSTEAQLGRVEAELAAARHRLSAIQMASGALSEASEALRRGVTPRLREDASHFFRELTGGKYEGMHLSPDFTITLDAGGRALPLSRFSAGCRDAAHLALRLALLGTLSAERLPLLFDEALSRFDDARAQAFLAVLRSYCREGGQCFLFTCHTREGEWLAGDDTVLRFSLKN